MPDPKEDTTPHEEQSGAGYGNNAETDDIGEPGEDEGTAEAHPS